MKQTATTEVISQSYLRGLILKCGVLFAVGLILTCVILYFSAHQSLGTSYQDSFARLAQLKNEMLIKSVITYFLLTGMILAGVIFITIIYSHRVVGPLVGIKRVIKALAAGDLTVRFRLREKDAIQPMATALNHFVDCHRERVARLSQHSQALHEMMDRPGDLAPTAEIAAHAKAIKEIVATLRLQ